MLPAGGQVQTKQGLVCPNLEDGVLIDNAPTSQCLRHLRSGRCFLIQSLSDPFEVDLPLSVEAKRLFDASLSQMTKKQRAFFLQNFRVFCLFLR